MQQRPHRSSLYGDGAQTRDFTYVDDIADGTIKALKPVGYEIINLGNNHPHNILELISMIEKGSLLQNFSEYFCLSFRRKPESSEFKMFWTPVFTGVTVFDTFARGSKD